MAKLDRWLKSQRKHAPAPDTRSGYSQRRRKCSRAAKLPAGRPEVLFCSAGDGAYGGQCKIQSITFARHKSVSYAMIERKGDGCST